MKNSVCAIIVTYRIGKGLLKCFDSIVDQVEKVVVVDNGADEETLSVLTGLEKKYDNFKVFYNGTNLGIAAGLNIGVRYAIGKGYAWILTLDHDSEATPQMVEKLIDTNLILSRQGVDSVGIIATNPYEVDIQRHLVDEKLLSGNCEVAPVERVISSGSMIRASVFGDVGFFNEALFMYYVDDDFCLRCCNKKYGIYICRSAVLLHKEGNKKTTKFLWKNPYWNNYDSAARYYISRNTIYIVKEYFKSHRYGDCFSVIKVVSKDMIKIILFEKNRIRLFSCALKGMLDGIAGKYGKIS